jgi:pimeloyl-ACP methyl ester carboxylesterase
VPTEPPADSREVVAMRSQVWRVDGTWIPVWTSGSGPKLLIVHGEATNHESWEGVRRVLNHCFTVITMDRRATFEYPFSALEMEQEIRDVAAVANSLDDDVTILGHSSGALCALGAAPHVPRLHHLLLYEPPLEQGEHVGPAIDRLDRLLRQGDLDGLVDTWLTEYLRLPSDAAEGIKRSEAGVEIRRYASYLPRETAEHRRWRLRPEHCADMGVPVTYLVGGNTPQDSREYRGMIAELGALVPDLRVRELAGELHFAHFSNPELLAMAVREALAD